MDNKPRLDIIGVPFALGGSKPGTAHGPEALIAEGLVNALLHLGYDMRYIDVASNGARKDIFTTASKPSGRIHSLPAVREVVSLAGAHVFTAHRLGRTPIVIGGDHSVSIGTLPQFLDPAISMGRKVGLVWIDAHFDAHTPRTTHSCYANGLPLASVLGKGPRKLGCFRRDIYGKQQRLKFFPENVLHIGAGESDCEPEEVALLKRMCVETITMRDIHTGGSLEFLGALSALIARVDDVILTLDLDAIRQDFAPAVSFPSVGGLLPSQILSIATLIGKSNKLRQVEIMEYNPDFEKQNVNFCPITAHLVFNILQQLFLESKTPHK